MRNFRELQVWQKARALALDVYTITKNFPTDECFGLTNQTRRAVISIASNISEGAGRNSDRDLARYLSIAAGSANELECQIILASDFEYLPEVDAKRIEESIQEIRKMLHGFIRSLTLEAGSQGSG